MPDYDITPRYVAMCDVLGFKNLVRDNPLRHVLDTYVPLIAEARRLTQTPMSKASDGPPVGRLLYDVFSDSIIVWTDPEPGEDINIMLVNRFFTMLCKFIGISLCRNIPIRIGIAYGECTMDPRKKLYIGKSLVDAYEAEQSQNWIGGACHESCKIAPYYDYMRMRAIGYNDAPLVGGIIDHAVPQRRKLCDLSLSIDWPIYSPMGVRDVLAKGSADMNSGDIEKWKEAYKYYDERMQLWNDIRDSFKS